MFHFHSIPLKENGPNPQNTLDNNQTTTKKRTESLIVLQISKQQCNINTTSTCTEEFILKSECAQKVINLVMRCFHPWVVNVEGHGVDETDVYQRRPSGSTAQTHTHTHINKCHRRVSLNTKT